MEKLILRDRRGTGCFKWDNLSLSGFGRDDLKGLWVADMDFACPEAVRNALKEAAEFGVFGYNREPEYYYDAFIGWERRRHQLEVKRDWIRFSPGVVAAFNYCVQLFTEPGDAVIIQTPVYYPFSRAVIDNGRKLVTNELVKGSRAYSVDFEDFEQKIIENDVKAFILCSPHNPVSRVWTEEELMQMLEICSRRGVFIIADEIHQDFVFDGHRQVPFLSISGGYERCLALTAPSKTFNLAGLKNSIVLIPEEKIRREWDAFMELRKLSSGNSLGYVAAAAAYAHGDEWLEAILKTVWGNYGILCGTFTKNAPQITVYPLEGTYLAWVDIGKYIGKRDLAGFMENTCGLAVDYGVWFGGKAEGCMRINLAAGSGLIAEAAEIISEKCTGFHSLKDHE